jgi:hypothetical protein
MNWDITYFNVNRRLGRFAAFEFDIEITGHPEHGTAFIRGDGVFGDTGQLIINRQADLVSAVERLGLSVQDIQQQLSDRAQSATSQPQPE